MKSKSDAKDAKAGDSPSRHIDAKIKELGDWRGEMLARIRSIIKQADPDVVEERKWRGVPLWEHHGIICTGETYKAVVKMTFAKGAAGRKVDLGHGMYPLRNGPIKPHRHCQNANVARRNAAVLVTIRKT